MKQTIYPIDGSNLKDLDRVVALQFAKQVMEKWSLPDTADSAVYNALYFAFVNGCSFRQNLTPEQEREMTRNYQPLIDHIFYGAPAPEGMADENMN